jgi:SNF2 family DNA or RNA helicase
MNVQIDYLAYSEQVIIINMDLNKNIWRAFYNFISDYLPVTVVSYSEGSICFSWGHFLSIKGFIGEYISAHRDQIKVSFTDIAKAMIKTSNDTSYNSSINMPHKTKEELKTKLHEVHFSRELTENQMTNLEKMSVLPGAATFSVPGAGKTTEALAYYFVNCLTTDRLLVVAPKNAFGAWDEQLDICVNSLRDRFERLRGGEDVIREMLKRNPRFMIITYDQLIRVRTLIVELLANKNIFMFLDESHRIKGGKQVKRADAILAMAHLPKRKLVMSGTPLPQGAKDLVAQFTFLYPAKDVTETTVIDLMQPIYVRTTKGQLGIPEVTHKVITVKMTKLQREIYKTLKSEIRRQINPALSDSSKYELRRIGKCVMKVMEFVSNPSLLSNDMEYAFDKRVGAVLLASEGPKIEYVCLRARQLAALNQKVIIWTCFVQNVELIALRLSDLGAEFIHGGVDAGDDTDVDTREGKIKRFHDDPNCMVLVANPAACSEGISLHKVCQYAIYLDRSFNSAHYLQSEDRIHRLGLSPDSKPCVEFVECENSIDQIIRERLSYKVNIMARALNDTSLKIEPGVFDYGDGEEEDYENITTDDAKAVINFFFGEVQDD